MRRDMWIAAGVTVFVAVAFALTAARDHASAQGLPPSSVTYSGTATAGGSPVPDGYVITARIGDYLSQPIQVKRRLTTWASRSRLRRRPTSAGISPS